MPGSRVTLISSATAFVLVLLLAPSISAQQRRGFSGRAGPGIGLRGGFVAGGSGMFRRGFTGFRGGFASHRGFARTSSIVSRGPFFRGSFFPRRHSFFGGHRSFFGYPRFGFSSSFGYLGYGYSPAYAYWPSTPVYYLSPSYAQGYVEPERIRESDRNVQREVPKESYWLIALKDQNILAVTDYWLDDSALHYVTRQGSKSSVELANIDLDFTRELNRERGREFRLPRSNNDYHPQRRDAYGRPY